MDLIWFDFYNRGLGIPLALLILAKLPLYVKALNHQLEFIHLYVGVCTILTIGAYGGLLTRTILM
jgi:predicted cation transporter